MTTSHGIAKGFWRGAAASYLFAGFQGIQAAFGADAGNDEVLLVVFLRGGCDGLNLVPPLAGKDRETYEAERPTLKIPATGPGAAYKLDDRFGLHPAAKDLHELFQARKLAIVHAAGLTEDTRSHFDAQNYMELGTSGRKTSAEGWLTRYLRSRPRSASGMNSLAVNSLLPTSLVGEAEAIACNGPGAFDLGGRKEVQAFQRKALRQMYQSGGSWLHQAGRQTLNAIDALELGASGDYKPAGKANYGHSDLGNRLRAAAQILKMPLGMQAIAVDMGGWDTHKNQGNGSEGAYAGSVTQLSEAVGGFFSDLEASPGFERRVTLVVMSEFGRRVRENASRGTDHGHGGAMLVVGHGIEGGKVYGRWPGLATESLYERADLAVTTDFRSVLSELLLHRFNVRSVESIFPGFRPAATLGLVSAKTTDG